jgi:hypothetical protein
MLHIEQEYRFAGVEVHQAVYAGNLKFARVNAK